MGSGLSCLLSNASQGPCGTIYTRSAKPHIANSAHEFISCPHVQSHHIMSASVAVAATAAMPVATTAVWAAAWGAGAGALLVAGAAAVAWAGALATPDDCTAAAK